MYQQRENLIHCWLLTFQLFVDNHLFKSERLIISITEENSLGMVGSGMIWYGMVVRYGSALHTTICFPKV